MKKIFTLFTFLLMAVATFAAWDDARLSITSMSNTPVRIMVDGRQVQQGNREIRINNLSPGIHRIQIYGNINNNNKRRGVFGNNNNRDELIYNNSVNIRRGMHTDIVINRFGKVFIDEERIEDRILVCQHVRCRGVVNAEVLEVGDVQHRAIDAAEECRKIKQNE